MKNSSRSLGAVSALLLGALADERYKSRPDLSPPRLNITIPASDDVADGFIFVCPYSGFTKGNGFDGPEQPAGYIFRDDGDLVWSSMGYLTGWVGNMQVSEWNGKPVISAFQGSLDSFHGHGFGHPTILDQNYENIRDIHGGNHKIISIHEFNVLESGSALVEVYQPTQMELSPYGGEIGASWIVDAIFQEIDLSTGDLLFEWSSLGHVAPTESNVTLSSGHAGDGMNSTAAWDYFHINSVDKDTEGNYLISARHASALYKINGKSGEIMWQLGGRKSDFTIDNELLFGFQHDARFVRKDQSGNGVEYVSLFDNAARANGHRGGGIEIVHSYSSAKVIRLDQSEGVAVLEVSLPSPERLSAPSQGNVQLLPNGNLFVGWGQGGTVTEFNHAGEAIFHAMLDSGDIGEGVQSYRAFRFPWVAYPNEAAAISASNDSKGQTTVYLSWNGDTETAAWRVFSKPSSCTWPRLMSCSARLLGQSTRSGFETSVVLPSGFLFSDDYVIFAEAIDRHGNVLVTTASIAGPITQVEGFPERMIVQS